MSFSVQWDEAATVVLDVNALPALAAGFVRRFHIDRRNQPQRVWIERFNLHIFWPSG